MPPMNSSAVFARGLDASIFPLSDLNSASVRSLVQHLADAGLIRLPAASNSAGVKPFLHFAARGTVSDVRRGVKIALGVTADELRIARERHIALR